MKNQNGSIIFDGYAHAKIKEEALKIKLDKNFDKNKKSLKIAAVVFREDAGSMLYTQKKSQASERVGIEYQAYYHSFLDDVSEIKAKISDLNKDSSVTGIIIQKPWRKNWLEARKNFLLQKLDDSSSKVSENNQSNLDHWLNFDHWWRSLISSIILEKDVDGLHPDQQDILPATVRAVLYILEIAQQNLSANIYKHICIVGKSDLLGYPLYRHLQKKQVSCDLLGKKELRERRNTTGLKDASVVISATGVAGLIHRGLIAKDVVLIDVGEPQPDVDFDQLLGICSFITPVPGGVGPLTVISLLENCSDLSLLQSKFHRKREGNKI